MEAASRIPAVAGPSAASSCADVSGGAPSVLMARKRRRSARAPAQENLHRRAKELACVGLDVLSELPASCSWERAAPEAGLIKNFDEQPMPGADAGDPFIGHLTSPLAPLGVGIGALHRRQTRTMQSVVLCEAAASRVLIGATRVPLMPAAIDASPPGGCLERRPLTEVPAVSRIGVKMQVTHTGRWYVRSRTRGLHAARVVSRVTGRKMDVGREEASDAPCR